jgi:hypothetical protein
MRRTTIAAATAAGLVLLSGTAVAAPPEGKGGDRAIEECENHKGKSGSTDDCEY